MLTGPELFALGSSSECYFQRLDDNDRMFEINITAYTKDTGHDIWSLDTDAGEWALVTSLLLAPEVGLTDEYLLHKILHIT